jgi:excisionase family DNA binding protein
MRWSLRRLDVVCGCRGGERKGGENAMETMTTKEAAAYIGVSVNTLRKYVHEEGLPVLRFPGRRKWVFRKDLIDDWIYRRSQPVIINDPRQENKDYGKLRVLYP